MDDLCGVRAEGQPLEHLLADPDRDIPPAGPELTPGGRLLERLSPHRGRAMLFFSSGWCMDRKREFRNMLLHPSLSECKRDAHKSVSSWKQNTHISPVGWDICLAGAQSDEIELEYNQSCHLQVCLCCRQKPGWNLLFCNQVNVQLFCIKLVWSGMIWWIRCQPLLSEQGLRQHIFYFIAFHLFNGDISNLWSTQISNYFEIFSRSTDQLAFRSAAGGNMTFVFFFDSPILFSSGNSLNLFHSCKMCMLECLRRAWGGSAKSI